MDIMTRKKALEQVIRNSHLASNGMKVLQCVVRIDQALGLTHADIAVNYGKLSSREVDLAIDRTFTGKASDVSTYATWTNVTRDFSSPSLIKIQAEGITKGMVRGK